ASDVPRFWYLCGATASLAMMSSPIIIAWLFRNTLDRYVDALLAQRADAQFAFAAPTLFAVSRIDAWAADIHTSLGLRPRLGASARCRRILIERLGTDQDAVLAALDAVKNAATGDLRSLQSSASEIKAGALLVRRVKANPHEAGALAAEIKRV